MMRKFKKWLALALFALALALAIPEWSDFLNVFIASFFVSRLNWDFAQALFITYTFLPLILFFLAVWIYPAQNGYVISKFKSKFLEKSKSIRNKFRKNPFVSIVISVIFFIVLYNLFKIYYKWISQFIT